MATIQVTDSRMYGLLALYDMHTEFFRRALVEIDDEAAQNRLGTRANHIAWITGSLVQQRFELANLFGTKVRQKNHELFDDFKGIQDGINYPQLGEFKIDWEEISPVLRTLLSELPTEKLDSIFDEGGMKMPYWDMVSYMVYREASCIGQIALWRRLLGFGALKYD